MLAPNWPRLWLALCLWCGAGVMAHASEGLRMARPLAEDPVLQARLDHLAQELRCLVCQNESLASSQAELAQDLRAEVRDLIGQGKSDPEIKQYLVQRYGDFVLYRPAFQPTTYLLWLGPFVFLALGLIVLWRILRARRLVQAPGPLSAQDLQRAEQWLKDGL